MTTTTTSELRTAKLQNLMARYGADFLKKLPLYKTARWNGKYVAILRACPESKTVVIRPEGSTRPELVDLTSLTDFVL